MSEPGLPIRPLLKWAGGKRQLLQTLNTYYPPDFDRYIEPFFGSGAVFFDLVASGRLRGRRARLADVNGDLVGCYHTLRDKPEEVVRALGALARRHRRGGDEHYYDVRDARFNPTRATLSGHPPIGEALAAGYTPELAAMLIYLNRTGFNGLFRLNRSGAFNVPVGRYTDPRICDPDHLMSVANVLRRREVTIELAPFERTLSQAAAGDFVYCDPPYAPLTPTSSFANYTAGGFDSADQARLADAVVAACGRGAAVVVSNSSATEILDLYSAPSARRVGLHIARVPARRAINARASSRGPVDELVITNVTPARAALPAVLPDKAIKMAKIPVRERRARTA